MSERLPYEEEIASTRAANNFRVKNRKIDRKRVIVEMYDDEIVNDILQVTVSNEGTHQSVMIYWEDGGYTNYHDYGLYGFYRSSYYHMKYGNGKLIIYGEDYTITIVE